MSEHLQGTGELHLDRHIHLHIQTDMFMDGAFRQPSPAYLRAIAQEPDRSRQATEVTLYALELCGAIRRRGDTEGDLRLLRSDIEDFRRQRDEHGYTDKELEHEKAILRQHLIDAEVAVEKTETLLMRIQNALALDALHETERREDITRTIEALGLDESPCFQEISAMESMSRDGNVILPADVTKTARRVLEMLVISDIHELGSRNTSQHQQQPETEAA